MTGRRAPGQVGRSEARRWAPLALCIIVAVLAPQATLAASPATAQATTPEQQLADAFAPIVMLKQQSHPCDRDGEAFLPAPVEVVFDDPEVDLVLAPRQARSSHELVMTAPNASDLTTDDGPYHLDFPGNPRNAHCTYEEWFRRRMAGHTPVTYANVVAGQGRVAIQYWFWYVFNDFNNTHEGDWERIQVIFDADSVEEALTEQPTEVGYSQHAGGERSSWDDEKLSKEGSHPIVYAASGSHASNFGSGIYLGWGENNSGFGCDDTTGPSDRIVPQVLLLPNDITKATGPLTWLSWGGRWGERQRSFYNGITGPGVRDVWTDPFTWQDERLRDSSIKLPSAETLGPGPTSVFCNVTEFGSLLLTRVVVYPWLVFGFIAVAIGTVILLFLVGGPTLVAALRMYLADADVFVPLGLTLIPIGLVAATVQFVVVSYPPGKLIFDALDRGPGARLAVVLTIGVFQQALNYALVGPPVIEAVGEIRAGRRPSFVGTYRKAYRRLKNLVLAVAEASLIVAALALSVIGIPWAISRSIRWLFVSQAVLLHGESPRRALATSAGAVQGHWWRTAATSLLLTFVGIATAPLLGIFVLIVFSPGIGVVNWLSSLVYAAMVPLSVIGLTLLYLQLRGEPAPAGPEPRAEPYDQPGPLPSAPPA